MRSLRKWLWVLVVAGAFLADPDLLAATVDPIYPACEDGCTCTIDPNDWRHVTIDCPNVAPVDECPYAGESFWQYCELNLPMAIGGGVNCAVDQFEGCTSTGLEPPTYIEGLCFCWYR